MVRFLLLLSFAILSTSAMVSCAKDAPLDDDGKEVKVTNLDIKTLGRLTADLVETSGIIVYEPNRIWSHNDKGNTNQLFLVDTTGAIIKTITVTNAQNIDWEDLTVDTQGRIYINNAGNNKNNRTNLSIYRIPNPNLIEGNTVQAEIIRFAYEDQTKFPPPNSNKNFDVEAIVWRNDSIHLFTKDRSTPYTGYTKNYIIPSTPGNYTVTLVDSFFIETINYTAPVTAADINLITGELVLLTKDRILSFTNYPGSKFFKGDIIDYRFTSSVGQVEAISFVNKRKLYITEEGSSSLPGNIYKVILP
jgi:archaellum component FlaG (FlaF/FlaG flagellin family)